MFKVFNMGTENKLSLSLAVTEQNLQHTSEKLLHTELRAPSIGERCN
jgi:hypothetical protein